MERFFSLPASWMLAVAIFGLSGCTPPAATPTPTTTPPSQSAASAEDQGRSAPATSLQVSADRNPDLPDPPAWESRESWYGFYMNGGKIGYSHYLISPERQGAKWLVRTIMQQQISLLRDGHVVTQELKLDTLESAAGEVYQLQSIVSDGVTSVMTTGQRVDGRMHITLEASGKTNSQTIDWDPTWRGFFAPEQLLLSKPLKAGEQHACVAFLPVLNVVARISLQAEDWEEVETPFGREKLLRIRSVAAAPQLTLESLLWCNAAGEVRRHYTPQAKITAHLTVKELALAENDEVDLYEAINIRVPHPLADPHNTRQTVYHARLDGSSDPEQVFVNDLSQRVRSRSEREVEIEVLAIRPDFPAKIDMPQSSPEAADLTANSLIQSDDPYIVEMAQQIAPQQPDHWQWVLACEQFVSRTIERKDLSQAFSSASEVAQLKAGDCTEHAVLTAALCRAHGIPARVVTGLVSVNDYFAFHMWNEVWIDDRWIAIDATLGRGGIGAGHIKLGVSSLQGVSPFAALAPVLEVMGSLELDVVSAR